VTCLLSAAFWARQVFGEEARAMVVRLKACERCGGDMSYERDMYGRFRQCLQCSYLEDLPSEAAAKAAKKREQAPESVAEAVKKDSRAREGSDVG